MRGRSGGAVLGRVDKQALHPARKLRLQRLQVIEEDQPIVEKVSLRNTVLSVIGLRRILQQNAWLQLRPVLLADQGQFESCLVILSFSAYVCRGCRSRCTLVNYGQSTTHPGR